MEVFGVAVEHKFADGDKGVVSVGPDFCDVVDVKLVSISVSNWHNLYEPVPGCGTAIKKSIVQIYSCEIFFLLAHLSSFSVSKVLDALSSLEVVLNQMSLTFGVDPLEGVRAVSVHVAIPIRGASVREQDHNLVLGLRSVSPEIKGHVGVLNASLWVTLLGVDEVRELNGVLDEEDGCVITDHVVVAFFGVEFYRKSSWITVAVVRTALTCNRGEANEDWRLFADLIKECGLREPIVKISATSSEYLENLKLTQSRRGSPHSIHGRLRLWRGPRAREYAHERSEPICQGD